MSHRFLLSLRKWPHAVQQALSFLDKASPCGETCSVDFDFGPPSKGRLPLQIRIDGQIVLRCELSDTNPSFLHDVRGWLERSLVRDREGTMHPELLTLDCAGGVLSLVIIHVGWEDDWDSRARPVSFFVAIRSGNMGPAVQCFCDTIDTILNFYDKLTDCLERFRSRFDSNAFWFDVHRFDKLNPVPTSERMLNQICSQKIQKLKGFR